MYIKQPVVSGIPSLYALLAESVLEILETLPWLVQNVTSFLKLIFAMYHSPFSLSLFYGLNFAAFRSMKSLTIFVTTILMQTYSPADILHTEML